MLVPMMTTSAGRACVARGEVDAGCRRAQVVALLMATAPSCQLYGLLSISGEVIVVNRRVLHTHGFVLVLLTREEHDTLQQKCAWQSSYRRPCPHVVSSVTGLVVCLLLDSGCVQAGFM